MLICVFTLLHNGVGIVAQIVTSEQESEMGYVRLLDKYNETTGELLDIDELEAKGFSIDDNTHEL